MTSNYTLKPIDPQTASQIRTRGGDRYIADQPNYFPCRQCLRDADVGESLLLVSYDPFEADSPYRSASPIFIHEHECAVGEFDSLPVQLTGRQLSVRAFDARANMHDAATIDGADLDDTLTRFFDDAATDFVHVHNSSRGCWATAVTRQPPASTSA